MMFSIWTRRLCWWELREMVLLRYLERKNRLPDPHALLASAVPSQAIAEANREAQAARSSKQKWGPYHHYSPRVRAQIGKYSAYHGVAAAAHFFSRKLNQRVSETRDYSAFDQEGLHWRCKKEERVGEWGRDTRPSWQASWQRHETAAMRTPYSIAKNLYSAIFNSILSWGLNFVGGLAHEILPYKTYTRKIFATQKFPQLR